MEIIKNLLYGLSIAVTPFNLLYCFIGVVAGVIIGALPGLGPSVGIAVLIPLTFGTNPVTAIIMLCGIYYGAMYGGSITSILINTPGDSAAVMTSLDGYPLAKKGQAGRALGMAAFSSIIGGSVGIIALMMLAPSIAKFALSFGPPEYFAVMLLGLTTISGLTGDNTIKGLISALLGLFLACVGLDVVQGMPRFTFGIWELYEGVDFIPAVMGLYGIAEVIFAASLKDDEIKIDNMDVGWRKLLPSKEDWRYSAPHIARGTGLGFLIGALPGAGATIAAILSYTMAKKVSKRGSEFGTGVIEGVAAPESANNAASMGAMVPLITLGVPGSGSTTVMLGALMMLGLRPGPLLFDQNPEFVWGLIGSMYIGNIILLVLAIAGVPLFIKVLEVPKPILNACIMSFILIGSYSLTNNMFNVILTILFGILGFFMKKLDFPATPMVLSLVLGSLMENSLRQSLIMSNGNPMVFFTRPVSCIVIAISIVAVVYPIIKSYNKGNKVDTVVSK